MIEKILKTVGDRFENKSWLKHRFCHVRCDLPYELLNLQRSSLKESQTSIEFLTLSSIMAIFSMFFYTKAGFFDNFRRF
jgi:ABC-type multidrug transport system permease subunit